MNQTDPDSEAAEPQREQQRRTIQQLNDALRVHGSGGRLLVSAGIAALGQDEILAIRCAVAGFAAFSPDNDPYGEHDCAILEVGSHRVLWKIDYFDADYAGHSPDPADPNQTQRVLTLMLVEEY